MNDDPQTGERWKHPFLGVGTVKITRRGTIQILFDNGECTACGSARVFHAEGFVRATGGGSR